METRPILIVGATGFVGRTLSTHLGEANDVMTVGRADLPRIAEFIDAAGPRAIVNCAAMASIADCEADPQGANRANADLPADLATASGPVRLIHLSTDQVFDGAKGRYREEDEPRPVSVYGRTKLEGERRVLSIAPDPVVLRLNLVCGRGDGNSSVDRMIADAVAGRTISLFEDEYRSPVALSDVVETIAAMIELDFRGILHVGGPRLSRYELGKAVLGKHGVAEQAVATSLSDYTGPPRTPDTSFDTTLAEHVLGRTPRDLAGILEDC